MQKLLAGALVALSFTLGSPANAAALRNTGSFIGNTLPANDDGSTGQVNLGFNANFYGATYDRAYVNNNGNITFDAPLDTFTPFNLPPRPPPASSRRSLPTLTPGAPARASRNTARPASAAGTPSA